MFPKRLEGIRFLRKTPEYQTYRQLGGRARSPDPDDHTVSKRSWEQQMINFRNFIRGFVDANTLPVPPPPPTPDFVGPTPAYFAAPAYRYDWHEDWYRNWYEYFYNYYCNMYANSPGNSEQVDLNCSGAAAATGSSTHVESVTLDTQTQQWLGDQTDEQFDLDHFLYDFQLQVQSYIEECSEFQQQQTTQALNE